MTTPDIEQAYLRICRVMECYDDDPTFFPRREFQEVDSEFNPTHDRIKARINRIEACVAWRERVSKSLRTQDELYWHEMAWRRRYMTQGECVALKRLLKQGSWNLLAEIAVKKVNRNFERWWVYVLEE